MTSKADTNSSLSYAIPIPAKPDQRDMTEGRILFHVVGGNCVFTLGALLFAYFILGSAFNLEFAEPTATTAKRLAFVPVFAIGLVLLLAMQYLSGLYQKDAIIQRRSVPKNMVCIAAWTGVFASLSVLVRTTPEIPLAFALLSGLIMAVVLPVWQLWLRDFLIFSEATDSLSKNVAIIGWNKEAATLNTHLKHTAHKPYRIVAHLAHGEQDKPRFDSNVAELSSIEDVSVLVENSQVDAVMVANYDMSSEEILSLHKLCGREVVDFIIMPPTLGVLRSGLRIQTVGNTPLMVDDGLPLQEPWNRALKRATDIVGSIVGLIISAPIIAAFCLLVYKESPGPVFYRQSRIGKKGKPFEIIKIRSMRLDAENGEKIGWTTQNDTRRLKIGALMRRLNIDELPQFWNVLKGDMSLVGPRPERGELIKNFKHDVEHYNFRHFVKPGITGWAQVNGWRGDTCIQSRINCDLEYMERWSLWLDAYIMLLTVTARQNAY